MLNPNAPRIEFFTTDSIAVAPGSPVTLFWSTRGVEQAHIYRLNRNGERGQVWRVDPAGTQLISTNQRDRGQVDFLLVVGEGVQQTEQILSVPLACPIEWFFSPAPDACPDEEAEETFIIEQQFERGRMVYIEDENTVYALFNDGREPAWITFDNRYDPEVHPESEENFVPPAGFYQPIAILGFLWRGNDTVRNRLGLGTNAETRFEGFTQQATVNGDTLYISSIGGTVLQLLAGGDVWQIITLP